jgi:hypothetical protein
MKKILKIALMILAGLLILGLVVSYISYSTYWADDPDIKADSTNLAYYRGSYKECRKAFTEASEELVRMYDTVFTGKIKVPSKIDTGLSINWCYIPARQEKEKLLIVHSGLHGIEGYTGSAMQRMFMREILPAKLPENMGVLLIHGVNPYGFKYHRKVTENNVDLNRNCVTGAEGFDIENKGYAALTGLLMPEGKVNYGNLRNQFFYLIAIYKIIQKSMPVLRQAALQGQYEFDRGFYYGGREYEPQIDSLKPFLTDMISQYGMLLNLDLHTAYGERGTLHIFLNPIEDDRIREGVETIFKGARIDWGNSSDFYTIQGEYIGWINQLVPDVLCLPMLFEFGTLDSQTTFGSLKSIQIMITENQGAHYGFRNKRSEQKVKGYFDEMYYPTSPIWRSKVLNDARDMMTMMMDNYATYQVVKE